MTRVTETADDATDDQSVSGPTYAAWLDDRREFERAERVRLVLERSMGRGRGTSMSNNIGVAPHVHFDVRGPRGVPRPADPRNLKRDKTLRRIAGVARDGRVGTAGRLLLQLVRTFPIAPSSSSPYSLWVGPSKQERHWQVFAVSEKRQAEVAISYASPGMARLMMEQKFCIMACRGAELCALEANTLRDAAYERGFEAAQHRQTAYDAQRQVRDDAGAQAQMEHDAARSRHEPEWYLAEAVREAVRERRDEAARDAQPALDAEEQRRAGAAREAARAYDIATYRYENGDLP